MKSMRGIIAVLSCSLLLGVAVSCSRPRNETQASGKHTETVSGPQEKAATESAPPIVVQQFMGCKAHR